MNAPQQTREKLLYKSAEKMIPDLRERARETAALGRLPEATIAEMQAAGFFRIMQPARYGGFEMDPEVFFQNPDYSRPGLYVNCLGTGRCGDSQLATWDV